MIPLRLRLRHFMSYAQLDLSFEGIHVAVLIGHNGAGKSALLDALTYAIWGRARAPSDQLVRLGESAMAVELTFGIGERVFRVRRRRSAQKLELPTLELDEQAGDDFISLTGATVEVTQARLLALVRIDYEAFLLSAYVGQGRRDSFASRSPRERRTLLGEVLGLPRYEALAAAARERLAAAQALAEGSLADRAAYDESAGARHALTSLLAATRDDVASLALMYDRATARRRRLAIEGAGFASARRACQEASAAHAQALTAEAEAAGLLGKALAEDGARRGRLAARTQIEADYAAWLESATTSFDDARRAAEARFNDTQAALLAVEVNRVQASAWQREAEQADILRGGLFELKQEIARLTAVAETLDALREEGLALRDERDEAEAEWRRVDALLADAQARHQHVATPLVSAHSRGAASEVTPRCPLCETALSAAELSTLQARGAATLDTLQAETTRLASKIQRHEAALRASRAHYAECASVLKALPLAQGRLEALTLKLAAAEAAQIKLDASLPDADRAQAAHEHSQAVLAEIRATDTQLQARRAALADAPVRFASLQTDLAGLEASSAHCARLEAERARHGETAARALLAARQADAQLAREPDWERETASAEHEVKRLQEALSLRESEAAAQASRLAGLDAELARLAARLAAQETVLTDVEAYAALAEAFGPTGIPATLMAHTVPELEAEANRLLARLSATGIRVNLTCRPAKKTLEIRVTDDAGPRAYELYSGGEAFRIDFALRLALSRLLTVRAGAPFRTLFIDEGFGSQDVAGRAGLIDAIQAIADELERVLVITHVPQIINAFTTRIEVTKRDGASEIAVAF